MKCAYCDETEGLRQCRRCGRVACATHTTFNGSHLLCAGCTSGAQPTASSAAISAATPVATTHAVAASAASAAPPSAAAIPMADRIAAAARSATTYTPERARQVITGSWVFTGIVGSFIALIILAIAVTPDRHYNYYIGDYVTGSAPTGLLLLIPVAYFAAWALFWGWGPVWRGWKAMLRGVGCPFVIGPIWLFMLFFMVIGAIALVYGTLAGFGLYSRAKRITQGAD